MAAPDSPTDLQGRSKLQTLKRTFTEFKEDELTDWAAALTYYAVLSLFPALIAMVSIVGLVVDPATVIRVITDTVSQLGPASAVQTFQGPIESITANQGRAGIMLIVGVVAALWSASGYVGAFMRASNHIYEVDEGRAFYKLRPLQMLVTLVLVLLVALTALALVFSGPLATAAGEAVGLGSTALTVWRYAKWPAMLLCIALMLAILYFASPNAKLPGFKWVTPGSLLALVVWILASLGFAFYVANFGSYDKTYGALGGVIVFLVWLWITNIAILLGAELNAETERSRQLEAGKPAERELQLEERDEASPKQRPSTAS